MPGPDVGIRRRQVLCRTHTEMGSEEHQLGSCNQFYESNPALAFGPSLNCPG